MIQTGTKVLIVTVSMLVFSLLGVTASYLRTPEPRTTTATVLLTFPGINQGKYPNGAPFDPGDFLDDPALHRAIAKLELDRVGISVTTLKPHLEVLGVEQQRLVVQAGSASPTSAFPSEYQLRLVRGESLGLSADQERTLVSEIIASFKQRYQAYLLVEAPAQVSVSDAELQAYDYPFLPEFLSAKTNAIREVLLELQTNTKTFRSPSLGLSFGDLLQTLDSTRASSLENIRSLIQVNRLTRDRNQAIRRYQEFIRDLEMKRAKHEAEVTYIRGLLAELDQAATSSAVQPGIFNLVEVLVKQDYRTALLKRSAESGLEAVRASAKITSFQTEIAGLSQLDAAPTEQREQATRQLEREVKSLQSRLGEFVAIIGQLRKEYVERDTSESISLLKPASTAVEQRASRISSALYLLVGLLVGMALVGLLPYLRRVGKRAQPGPVTVEG